MEDTTLLRASRYPLTAATTECGQRPVCQRGFKVVVVYVFCTGYVFVLFFFSFFPVGGFHIVLSTPLGSKLPSLTFSVRPPSVFFGFSVRFRWPDCRLFSFFLGGGGSLTRPYSLTHVLSEYLIPRSYVRMS